MAWWHAVPKAPPSKAKKAKLADEKLSRMALRLKVGEPDLPHVDPALLFLIDYLFEAGPVSVAGMGSIPLTWADLQAWERATGVTLTLWQSRLLRHLSAEYLAESMTADAHDAPPPWSREADRERVARHVKNVLRG